MKMFDAHFHIIDFDFPIIENQSYTLPNYVTSDYQKETTDLNILGGEIVSGSFQGFNQDYLLKALKQMGPAFCGVTQLPFTVTDDEILNLHNNGVRALLLGLGKVLNALHVKVFHLQKSLPFYQIRIIWLHFIIGNSPILNG